MVTISTGRENQMAYELCETGFNGALKRPVANFETFEEAKEHVHKAYQIVFLSDDPDYPGCADFITKAGSLYVIQPIGFKVTG